MRTANPALQAAAFSGTRVQAGESAMTIQGTINKTALLLLLVVSGSVWVWSKFLATGSPAGISGWMILGALGGFIAALVTIFKKTAAPVSAPIYALLEGFFIGGISALFEAQYPGLVVQAVTLTFGTLFALLAAYSSGVIKVTDKFRMGVVAATGGIALIYLVSLLLGFFGINLGFIYGSGFSGILFSLFVVTIAALNLVLDFDFIAQGARYGAPKYMEWYGAFGLMVTLIWLYIEILRLLAKSRERR